MWLPMCKNVCDIRLYKLKAGYKVIADDDSILAWKLLIYDCLGIQQRSGRQYNEIWLTEVGSNK